MTRKRTLTGVVTVPVPVPVPVRVLGILLISLLLLNPRASYADAAAVRVANDDNNHKQHQNQHGYEQQEGIQSMQSILNIVADQHNNPKHHRNLAAIYGCNEVIATIHPSELVSILTTFVTFIAPNSVSFFIVVFQNIMIYGMQVKTVCAKCISSRSDVTRNYSFTAQSKNTYFETYCGKDSFGYDVQQSGLVMIPLVVDDDDELVFKDGTLTAFIHNRILQVNQLMTASQMWSTTEEGHIHNDMMKLFLATSIGGTVSFSPDYMGYGLSGTSESRNMLIRNSYVTNFLPLFVKVSADLSEETDCKTALADAAFVQGYSEGGYAAIAIADGLNKALNIDIINVRAGGVPTSLEVTIVDLIRSKSPDNIDYQVALISIGAALSPSNPNVPNYNQGQNFLKDKYNDPSNPELYFIGWLQEDDATKETISARVIDTLASLGLTLEDILTEFLNPVILSFLQGAADDDVDNPCTASYSGYEVGVNDLFCEALMQQDLTDVLYNVNYPVSICHSSEDNLISYKNVPDVSLNPDYLSVSTQVGDHLEAGALCVTGDFLSFTSQEFRNYAPAAKHKEDGCGINTNECEDSPFRFKTKRLSDGKAINRDCKWVKTKSTNYRCGHEGASMVCPLTCKKCSECVDSSVRVRFVYNGKKISRDCSWVKKKNTLGRCKIAGMVDTCRETCNNCVA